MPRAYVNGTNLYYQVHGEGVPLLLIMGFGGGHEAWFFQVRAFRKHYRVITFDNRGVGRSSKASAHYTVRTLADDTVALMDYLNADKAHIVGLSLGGMVAQEIAINYPDRVKKLVIGSSFASRGQEDAHPELLKAMGLEAGSADVTVRSIDHRKLMGAMVSFAFNRRLYRMILLPLARRRLSPRVIQGQLAQLEAVAGCSTQDRLHLIQAPTLVITGTGDKLVRPHQSEVIAGCIPNARLVQVEGGSHAFFVEMRSRFNREVLDFLRSG